MGLTRQQITMITVLMAGTLLAVLNQTLLSPALPAIMGDLGVSATTVQWLTSGYSLVEAVIIPLNAYFVGRFSTRKLFIGGIGLFAIGSATAALAPNFAVLLLGRMLQACATGIVMPMVFTLILLIFPREKRGGAMGIIGLIISFAPAIGPSLSGVLVDSVGWRALFAIVTTLAVIVVVLSVINLKNFSEFEQVPFDVLSVVLLGLGMVGLLYGLSTFTGGSNTVLSVALMLLGLALLGVFVWRQQHLDVPLLRIGVLRSRNFRIVVIVIALLQAALVGSGVVLPIYVQSVLGQTATTSGLIMLPGALLGAVCGVVAGRLFDRYGVRGLALVGSAILLFGSASVTLFGMDTSVLVVMGVYTTLSLGIQLLITPLNTWGVNSLPNAVIQHGNALISTTNQVGASFGTALIVSLTALAGLVAPAGAGQLELTYAGEHLAFMGMAALLIAVAASIVAFVRDVPQAASVAADEQTQAAPMPSAAFVPGAPVATAPGTDRPWLVADIMNPASGRLEKGATVRDAIALLRDTETSGLPIVDAEGKVCAFISDGDILKHLSRQDGSYTDSLNYFRFVESDDFAQRLEDLLDMDATRIATPRVVSIDAGMLAEDAFKMLSERRIKKLPVTKDGVLVGSLSRRNIMNALGLLGQLGSKQG